MFILNKHSNFQHGISRPNQLATPAPRIKLRKACRQQPTVIQASRVFSSSANCKYRGDDHQFRMMPAMKSIKISDSSQCIKQMLMPGNIKKHFVRTMNNESSNSESPHVDHQQVIHNYLNQTMPSNMHQHPRVRDCASCQSKCEKINVRLRNVGRSLADRSQPRHSFDDGCVVSRRSSTTCDKSKFLKNYNQNHGIITASIYKDLCNETG